MRTLVVENQKSGHYYLYLSHILPSLSNLVERVDVAITQFGFESPEFKLYLEPLKDKVTFHPILPLAHPRERLKLYRNLRDAVSRFKPEYLLVPSGDAQTSPMGWYRATGRGGLPTNVPGEVGIHYGSGSSETDAKDQLKDLFYLVTQKCSTWQKIHYVNLLYYERAKAWSMSLGRRAELMSIPVEKNPRLGKAESRRKLGIPEHGRYIGTAGVLDERKGIDKLLAAFRAGAGPTDRLLLAGRITLPSLRALINSDYADLVRQERLILFDGFLENAKLQWVMSALDVAAVTSPSQRSASTTLIHAISAGVPVLVHDIAWVKFMVSRFGFGQICNVFDPAGYAKAIGQSLDRSPDYRETASIQRFLDFYAPRNVAAQWTQGIRQAMGKPEESAIGWESVMESLKTHGPATFGR